MDVLVSYYGSALRAASAGPAGWGRRACTTSATADAYVPMDSTQRDRGAVTAQPDVSFEIHPGAGHAFDNPAPAFHHAGASAAAWASTVQFLFDHLRPGSSTLPSDLAVASRARAAPAGEHRACEGARMTGLFETQEGPAGADEPGSAQTTRGRRCRS